MTKIPSKGALYRHASGNIYEVKYVSNLNISPARRAEFPIAVFYENVATGDGYHRLLPDWNASKMTEIVFP
jgi:hypothetical protein